MPKKALRKPGPTDADWRALGYTVEGPPGARVLRRPPPTPKESPPKKPDPRPARRRGATRVPDGADPRLLVARERLRRYLKLRNHLVWHFMNRGPIPPRAYSEFCAKYRLMELCLDVVNLPERGWPPLLRLCENCLARLKDSQKHYCSARCGQAIRVRRHRDRHPEHKLTR